MKFSFSSTADAAEKILPQLKSREKIKMKSKILEQRHESNYSTEIIRAVVINFLIAALLIAAAELLSMFKQMLFG